MCCQIAFGDEQGTDTWIGAGVGPFLGCEMVCIKNSEKKKIRKLFSI